MRGIAHGSRSHVVPLSEKKIKKSLYPSHNPLDVVKDTDKVLLMQQLGPIYFGNKILESRML